MNAFDSLMFDRPGNCGFERGSCGWGNLGWNSSSLETGSKLVDNYFYSFTQGNRRPQHIGHMGVGTAIWAELRSLTFTKTANQRLQTPYLYSPPALNATSISIAYKVASCSQNAPQLSVQVDRAVPAPKRTCTAAAGYKALEF
jgi:hypothetical protein